MFSGSFKINEGTRIGFDDNPFKNCRERWCLTSIFWLKCDRDTRVWENADGAKVINWDNCAESEFVRVHLSSERGCGAWQVPVAPVNSCSVCTGRRRVTSPHQEQSRQPVPLIVIITITTNDIIISLQMTALNRIIEAYLCPFWVLSTLY